MFVKETSCDNCTTGCDDSTIKYSHGKSSSYGASASRMLLGINYISLRSNQELTLETLLHSHRLVHLGWNFKMAETQLESFSQEWFYIPVGGSLPNTEQKNLAVDTFRDVKANGRQRKRNGRRNLASNYTDANNGRSAAFKRQSGANHIIRGLRNASPAPIKATIETIPCSIKESNPVIPPSGVRNRNITEEHTPFKSTSSSDDLTELKKPKATENEPYQIFLCESISKKEIAVKKSANCLQFGVIQSFEFSVLLDAANIVLNKPHGMAVQGGTGVKASIDELYAATCLTFDKSESPQLVHRLDRDCSGLLVLGRTQTAATPFHCIFLEKTTVSQIPSFYFDDKFLLPTQMELNILLYASSSLNEQGLHRVMACHRTCDGSMNRDYTVLFPLVSQGVLVSSLRCVTCVSYLSSKVGSITEAPDGLRFISCEKTPLFRAVRTFPDLCGKCLPLFLLEKLLPYEVGRRRVSLFKLHMARGGEQMVCMNYGEYANQKVRSLEAEYPTFLYAMPMTKTKVLFESVVPCQKNLAFGAAASMVGCSE
ncbi:LOW QUALITY PROTEIN: hypothetical protein HID58_090488 [Brassica napus]|uniref:Pseudouridine synthase RsuA/RluA-like domain-containing protein n=1 Tax=Brassica napus TaxID=3708 RepID=A0ABQ7X089_BRANA|nr:LOW QUALITY PROTEIN: hypothetical protein HID58_090488 [Brassica napus]